MESMIKCELCGEMFRSITWKHLKYWHGGMTVLDYQIKFPNAPVNSREVLGLRSDGIRNSYNFETRREAGLKGWRGYTEEDTRKRLEGGMLSGSAKEKNKDSHREMFSKMSSDEKKEWAKRSFGNEESVEKRTKSIRKFHSEMSEEETARWVKQSFHNLTPEEQEKKYLRISEGVQRYWDSRTPEQMMEWSELRSKIQKEVQANRTPEQIEETSRRLSESLKAHFENMTSEGLKEWGRSHRKQPTMPELFLGIYLERNFPGEKAYNGDGSQGVKFGRRIPDFTDRNGKKEVIEVLGGIGYFHFLEDEEKIKSHYKKYGYDCIVVWEWDCYLPEELDKIFGRRRVKA